MTAPMKEPWRVTLLGGLSIRQGHKAITRFRAHKYGGLLAYLAYHLPHMQSREVLLVAFWPEMEEKAARANLSVALSSLRNQLEPPGTPQGSVLRADRHSVGLNPTAVTTDVQQFEEALIAAQKTGSSTERAQHLSTAVGLYKGRLLPGFYEDWITAEAERLSGLFFDAAAQLIALLEGAGDVNQALSVARHAVAVDPLREKGQEHLIRLLAGAGQPGAALRRYKEFERLLEEETGDEPSAPLRALVRRIEKESGISAPPVVPVVRAATTPAPQPLLPVAPGGSATVNFLLTDIEESTRLWEKAGEAFRGALERHHRLLREAFSRHGGQEIKEAGDSFVVAFASSRSALACAVEVQRALAGESWPEAVGPLRVRMAIHTGDVDYRDGEYHGLVLHRASRMLTAAHGGQILVSEATASLLRRDLPEEVRLLDLGVYRLRDVPSPERLFQAEFPGMAPEGFGPLSADAGHEANLPLTFTRFFGREREITMVVPFVKYCLLCQASAVALAKNVGSKGLPDLRMP